MSEDDNLSHKLDSISDTLPETNPDAMPNTQPNDRPDAQPDTSPTANTQHISHLLHFVTAGVHYCIPAATIKSIIPLVALQKVPSSANYLCGLLNLHGAPIPAIDLSLLLALENPDQYTLDTAIIICRGEPDLGLIVTDVRGIIPYIANNYYHYSDDNQTETPIVATLFNDEAISYILSMDWIVDKVALHLVRASERA
ncbi:MAG: chemotaxis signal transduction protein [Phenylobacterium sp.]|jgi:chemotaxis signal transduction protein